MYDKTTTVADLRDAVKKIVDERDWNQFHSPKNLAINLSLEANELMEHFVWDSSQESFEKLESEKRLAIEHELADTMIALCAFANASQIDIAHAVEQKIAEIAVKYPVEKAKGNARKYNEL